MPDHTTVIANTEKWIADFIIGFNICPFAAKPFRQERIRYMVAEEAKDISHYFEALEKLLRQLESSSTNIIETAFLIFEEEMSFEDYLDLTDIANAYLEQTERIGIFQIAPFHPNFIFDDALAGDPANKTNQSPYPTWHLIREESISKAVETYPNIEEIPTRNIAFLRREYKE